MSKKIKQSNKKEVVKRKNKFSSEEQIKVEVRRYDEVQDLLDEIEGLVKEMPNISFDDLNGWLELEERELSLALFLLTSQVILYKGRFGYFHKDKFDKSKKAKSN